MRIEDQFVFYGKKCVDEGMTTSFFGNISLLQGDLLYITASGAMLDNLDRDDILQLNVKKKSSVDKSASSELCVHRKIYERTSFKGIIHAHSMYTVILAKYISQLTFQLAEVLPFLDCIPVVEGRSGSLQLAEEVAAAAENSCLVVVKEHGVFAQASSLKEAYVRISALEYVSKKAVLEQIYYRG
ncbi:MAG: fuculose phosphate aldolase [Flexistipes sinusarabici]|uniref:Fuculose phosphate aldolase n=1 Tax=Flexistipes sinusarabici TaxID=2352 RepID=A0A5D0MPI7_FLESI|nr:class II aldolase/adducin family protein [Flexistipes sinusarabici]TYB34382.1 MAG: fuculose phosphate aldolase [Flexistipes sinusarabici]